MKISRIKSDLEGREGLKRETQDLIKGQAFWQKYVQSQCQLERRWQGMTFVQ